METLSPEILKMIFVLLNREGLSHFRLTAVKFAGIGRHLILRHGLVIPCISTIFEHLAVIQKHQDIAANVKTLTLLSCRWHSLPDKREWMESVKNSELFGAEKLDGLDESDIDKIYMDTKSFVAAQCDADSVVADIITRAIQSFPNLEVIIPTYLPSWHEEPSIGTTLTKVLAFPNRDSIRLPLYGILRGLRGSHETKLRYLNLSRHTPANLKDFKPLGNGTLGGCSAIECIHLSVYERVGRGDEFPVRRTSLELSDVLRLFPSLRELHIQVKRSQGVTRMVRGYMDQLDRIIGDNVWHRMESVYLSYIWCTEDELVDFLSKHAGTLKSFGLGEVYFLDGDWGSFFRRLGGLVAQGGISLRWLRLDGKLGGYRPFFLHDFNEVSFFSKALPLQHLANYMEDISADWSLVRNWERLPHVEQLPGKYRIRISESAYEVVDEPRTQ